MLLTPRSVRSPVADAGVTGKERALYLYQPQGNAEIIYGHWMIFVRYDIRCCESWGINGAVLIKKDRQASRSEPFKLIVL